MGLVGGDSRSAGTDAATDGGSVSTIGTASTALATARAARIELFITNTHGTQILSLSLGGTAVAGRGLVLQPNQTLVLTSYSGAVNAIASGAGTTVAVVDL